MGIKIYSKIESLVWPNNTLLAQKCLRVYNDYVQGNDITQYQFGMINKRAGVMSPLLSPSASRRMQTPNVNKRGLKAPGSEMRNSMTGFDTAPKKKVMHKKPTRKVMHEEFQCRGRCISLDECGFVFKRVWDVTADHKHEECTGAEHHHEEGDEIMLTELFHIINLAGILLNKAAPDDSDHTPFEQFQKYA